MLIHVQVYIIGGDGTQKGAAVIYEVILFIKLDGMEDLGLSQFYNATLPSQFVEMLTLIARAPQQDVDNSLPPSPQPMNLPRLLKGLACNIVSLYMC